MSKSTRNAFEKSWVLNSIKIRQNWKNVDNFDLNVRFFVFWRHNIFEEVTSPLPTPFRGLIEMAGCTVSAKQPVLSQS